MLKKVLLQTQFGTPHPWTEQYFENFRKLEQYGWYMKVFSPNHGKTRQGNIETVYMTLEQFDGLMASRCGIQPAGNYLATNGGPAKLVSDYYPAYGHIFSKWLEVPAYLDAFPGREPLEFPADADYWGFTNWDMVYGRLDHFLPDIDLYKWDVWTDDVNTINGIFTLMRNTERINNLFREVPHWQHMFTDHDLYGFDERHFSRICREQAAAGNIRFGFPKYGWLHGHDREPQHVPKPNLVMHEDGALLVPKQDVKGLLKMDYQEEGLRANEIMMFHFKETKRWPL